jgi:uncharacterized repeat protein (TIGR02543 family)
MNRFRHATHRRGITRSIAITLTGLLVLPPFGNLPVVHATATSVEYVATSDYITTNANSSRTWAPSVGSGNATVTASPPYGSTFGFKSNDHTSYPIRIPHNDITNLSTTEPRTVQIWANVSGLPSSGHYEFFTKYGASWDGYYLRFLSTGAIQLITNGGVEIRTSSADGAVSAGQWQLITMVAQIGGVRKVYVDDTLVIDTPSGADSTYVNTGEVMVGGFIGCIGGFRAHRGELTVEQIRDTRTSFTTSGITGVCPATVTVTYNGNNNTSGVAPASASATTDLAFSVATAGTLARSGYTFSGWNTKADGTGTDYAAGTSITWNTGINTTLFAKWTPNTLTVSYDANLGSITASGPTTTTTGATMTSLPTAVRAGYTLRGWFTASSGGTQVTTSTGHGRTSDFTLFAQWTAATFTVNYTYNGADGGNSTASATYSAGDPALTLPTPTRAGYTFDGWYEDNGFTTLIGAGGASYSPTSTLTAYAKWTANSLTVTYDTQGGSAIADGATLTGGTIAASPGSPTNAGFVFDGWFVAPSGGAAISFPYSHGQSSGFTLYAQWTPVATTTVPTTTPTPTTTVTPAVTTATVPATTTTTVPATTTTVTPPVTTIVTPSAQSRNRRSTTTIARVPTPTTTVASRSERAPVVTTSTTTTTTTTTTTPTTSTTTAVSTTDVPTTIATPAATIVPVARVVPLVGDLSQPVLADNQLPKADPQMPLVIQTDPNTAWDVITINQRVVQMRDQRNFRLSVSAQTETGEMSEVNARGAITLTHGYYITVSGEGYKPGTDVVAWLFSTPRQLGMLRVGSNGTFQSSLLVNSGVEFGEHTVQVNGFSPTGELRSLNLAVEVVDLPPSSSGRAQPSSSDATSVQWLALGLVLLLGIGLVSSSLLVVARRRQRLLGIRDTTHNR